MKILKDYGDDFMQFLELPDDTWIFTKGACHAFALELSERFQKIGREAGLYYVSSEHPDIANHVIVKSDLDYWDVGGKSSHDQILKHWAKSDAARLRHVDHPGWISVAKSDLAPDTSFLGLFVNPQFLDRARVRARAFITSHRVDFGFTVSQSLFASSPES